MLDFRVPIIGSLKSSCTTSYRSSIEAIAQKCLVFEKIAFFADWRQTDGQHRSISHSRCHERRLKKQVFFAKIPLCSV